MTATFRETLWFKRGDLMESCEGDEAPVPLPIEDRYLDTGTIYDADSFRFGLHCGQTTELPVDRATDVGSVEGPELHTLARELKRSRTRMFATVCASVFAVAAVLIGVL